MSSLDEGRKLIVVGSYITALVMDAGRIPLKGETLVGRGFRSEHGGKGSNQAVQAARLGVDTHFVGKVGTDAYAEAARALMSEEGVSGHWIQAEGRATAIGFIITSEDGGNIITLDLGILNDFTPSDVQGFASLFDERSLVLLQLENPLETSLGVARMAKAAGARVVLNPAPAVDLSDCDLSCIDFLTPNETEAALCIGKGPESADDYEANAAELRKRGVEQVIVTLGSEGCYLSSESGGQLIPGFPVENVVDTTGAGDSFNAAFCAALLEGKSVADACVFGHQVSSLSVTRAGTIASFRTRSAVQSHFSA